MYIDVDYSQLNRATLENVVTQVLIQLKSASDPLLRYAHARFLKGVIDQVVSEASAAAVDYCHKENIGLDGTHFKHEGLEFSLDYRCEYNYGDNDTAHPRG